MTTRPESGAEEVKNYDSLSERELLGRLSIHQGVRWDALAEAFDVDYETIHTAEHEELYGDDA